MPASTRKIIVATLMSALLVVSGPVASAPGKEQSQKVTIALNGFENNMTPFTHTFLALPNTHDLVNLVYDTLFWSQVKETPEPWLAERADPSNDRKVWTVKLRPGVVWQDDVPFTADDVKFSFEYYQKMPQFSGRYAHHVADTPPLDRVDVVDPLTARIAFKQPAPTFPVLPGADLPIIPKHQWEHVTEPGKFTQELPIGTGPYKMVQMQSDQLYRFEANEKYFKGKPLVKELVMPIVRDPAAAFASLKTGQVDLVPRTVPPELVDEFSRLKDVKVVKGNKFESLQLYWNARKPPLNDPKLRKAISLAVNNDALVKTVLLGHGRPGRDSFIHPDSPWAVPGGTHEFDVGRANGMLDEAGYTQKDADGVRKAPNGGRLEFSVLVSSFEPQQIRASQLVAQQASTVGVKLNVESLDPATLRQRRSPPAPGQIPTYDAYVSGLEAHAHVDPDGIYYFFHSPGPKGFGGQITGYSNPRLDALSEKASVTTDLNERKGMLYEMQRILADDIPVLVLFYPDGIWAYRPSSYDQWLSDPGHGIFTKRSFLPGYPRSGQAATGQKAGTRGTPWEVIGIVAAVVIAGVVVVARRRRPAEERE
jgi:peptide/nickel transport system substrate-binding protein